MTSFDISRITKNPTFYFYFRTPLACSRFQASLIIKAIVDTALISEFNCEGPTNSKSSELPTRCDADVTKESREDRFIRMYCNELSVHLNNVAMKATCTLFLDVPVRGLLLDSYVLLKTWC